VRGTKSVCCNESTVTNDSVAESNDNVAENNEKYDEDNDTAAENKDNAAENNARSDGINNNAAEEMMALMRIKTMLLTTRTNADEMNDNTYNNNDHALLSIITTSLISLTMLPRVNDKADEKIITLMIIMTRLMRTITRMTIK
jgi:hypothetical protein